ncbi:MAG: hypothetical protein WC805_02360 [Patescibacteria group bacterium]|jgi:hypothetical protein
MKTKNISHSTQKYLPFKEIKEGAIVMPNGSLRAVLMVNAINFNLKSSDEQTALVESYRGFLNSLDFPMQIVIQSRILDLDSYLKNLETMGQKQDNELLQFQTMEYIQFVQQLIGLTNIMSKTFYIVISQDSGAELGQGFFYRLFHKQAITPASKFKESKSELLTKANMVANGLSPLGINSVLLNTKELIDLFYATYNPDIARRQKLFNISHVDADVITALSQEKK